MKTETESLSPTERASAIAYFHQQVALAGHNPSQAEDVLVNLGDNEAIAKEAQTFPTESTGGGSFLIWTIQPKVVPALMPNVFVTEPSPEDENGFPSKSLFTTETIRELLERSPYFSPAVNQWAASWKGRGAETSLLRDALRKWWTENRGAFETADYAAVQPGDPRPGSTPATLSEIPLSMPTPFPEVMPSNPVSSPSASPIPLQSKETIWPLILSLATTALVVGSLLVFLRAKK